MKREVLEIINNYIFMEGEINSFIKVWLSVFISLSYCYYAVRLVPKGTTPLSKLLLFLPIISLFLFLPLKLHSMHLGGMSSFLLAWLANFKLILFAFNKGPLSHPSISLPQFIALACLPTRIQKPPVPDSTRLKQTNKIQQLPVPNSTQLENINKNKKSSVPEYSTQLERIEKIQKPSATDSARPEHIEKIQKLSVPNSTRLEEVKGLRGSFKFLDCLIKGALVAIILKVYDYSDHVHPLLMWFVYYLHMYFMLDIMITFLAAFARAVFQLELEPQFCEPYLSTSLQDFWGRRWNLTVTRILRPSVYEPVHKLSSKLVGSRLAPLAAVIATFAVSAIMHELIFYYLGRVKPTGEITWFFMIHGVSLAVEIVIKRRLNGSKWRFPAIVPGMLTICFVLATGNWLFLPPLLRLKAIPRGVEECRLVGEFFKDLVTALKSN